MRLFSILSILLFILFVPFVAVANEPSVTVEPLKSATEYDFPPFSVTNQGVPDGFSVALLKAVADEMNLDVVFTIGPWHEIKNDLIQGELDVLPFVAHTTEREEFFSFSVPYIILHGNIFVHDHNTSIQSEEDLYGKKIIVMKGDSLHEYAKEKQFSNTLILTETYTDAFQLLSSGQYDAVLAQSIIGQQLLNEMHITNVHAVQTLLDDGVTMVNANLQDFEMRFCFAIPKGNCDLREQLNEGLIITMTNGTYLKLYNEWFSFLNDNKISLADRIKSSLIIIIPSIVILLLFAVISVERLIKKKTNQLKEANEAILSMEAGIRNKQKLESIGTLASGIAHEINNPINGIMNYSQLILDSHDKKKDAEFYAKEIIIETNRIAEITKNLLRFSHPEQQGYATVDILAIINQARSLSNTLLKKDHITLTVDVPKDLPKVYCRFDQICQVMMNLLANARDALNDRYPTFSQSKTIHISSQVIERNGKEYVRTTVEDHGIGIPKNIQDKIFDPFFSTYSKDKRSGIGLAISYNIIEEHGGSLSFESKYGVYTKFHLDLLTSEK